MQLKRLVLLMIFVGVACNVLWCQNESDDYDDVKTIEKEKLDTKDYIPVLHGTIRAKYEYTPTFEKQRFQVRNARVSVTGHVLPIVAYKAEIDLSDAGKLRMLDAYVRVFPVQGMQVTMGQMKIPFSTENLRSPHNMFFANRSFIAKQVTGFRDVGLSLGYELKEGFPFQILGGVFNGNGIYEQSNWQNSFDAALRAVFLPTDWLHLSLNFLTVKPESLRMVLYDASAYTNFSGFHLEAEYLYKTYYKNILNPTQAFVAFACYTLPLPKVFTGISFLVRYDMMTDNNEGYFNDEGKYSTDDIARQRMTYGITLSLGKKNVVDLRLNYEDYWYVNEQRADVSEQDKLVVEIMARF